MTRFLLAAVFTAATSTNLAWSKDFLGDDTDKPAFEETAWQLPAAPLPENLLNFYVSSTTKQSFAIDTKSLTVDTDGVVRYTLVGTSAGGAKNISYEGIRCATFEKKVYAFGHADGSWIKARNSEWMPIPVKGANLQQATLAQEFVCQGTIILGTPSKIIDGIRYPKNNQF